MRPNRPQSEAGTLIEPLVSEPSASGTSRPATAPPEPPDEPPVMRLMSCGLREGPVMDVLAGEVVGVFAHIERAHQDGAGGFEPLDQRRIAHRRRRVRLILEPASVGSPSMSNRFLTAKGTPASGPSGLSRARSCVDGLRAGAGALAVRRR